jgi:hypothetical protein
MGIGSEKRGLTASTRHNKGLRPAPPGHFTAGVDHDELIPVYQPQDIADRLTSFFSVSLKPETICVIFQFVLRAEVLLLLLLALLWRPHGAHEPSRTDRGHGYPAPSLTDFPCEISLSQIC